MTRHHQLKNEARRAEQRSDWARAIELYKSAIHFEEERGSGSDVGIYNRVGDLYLRQGDTASAVEYYEQAADRYASHGLHTSAIALCNKILRIAPDRDEVHGRLARLHASTGLLAEARSAFLRFAERMRETDRLSDALEAVQDLVSLTGDEELRTAFAEQLVGAGLGAQAVAQLRLVYQARVAGGRNAQDIRERIVALDPDADPIGNAVPPPPRATPTPDPLVSEITPPDAAPAGLAVPPVATDRPDVQIDPAEYPLDVPASAPRLEETGSTLPEEHEEGDHGVESVLTRFRMQVRDIVEETDHAVHYDLGAAYMGMGLLDEAIGEFRLAMQSPALMESAHALLGECLRARGGPRSTQAAELASPVENEPVLPLALTDDFMLGQALDLGVPAPSGDSDTEVQQAADGEGEGAPAEVAGDIASGGESPVDPSAGTTPEETSAEEDALADTLLQASLAQHRIRTASEQGRADYEAHLDLGRSYEQMGLLTEAVRDLTLALDGPVAVKDEALDVLGRIASAEGIEAATLRDALARLLENGRGEFALEAGREFVQRPGIREVDRQAVLAVLPSQEPDLTSEPSAEGLAHTEKEALAELGDILAELDHVAGNEDDSATVKPGMDASMVDPAGAPGGSATPLPPDDPAAAFGEAEGLRAAGRMDEAETYYYQALELFEKKRDAINAIRAVDRLLGLRPDDVVLHHQKNEFAIMTNDRELLISSYLDLAACLRRQDGFRSARTVYGRILDLDPQNAEARAGIAAVDADELARERRRQQQRAEKSTTEVVASTPPAHAPDPASSAPGAIDAMFQDLRSDGEEADESAPDYESHYELGVAFRQMEMWDEAAREFKLAVQGMGDPLPAYEHLGECLLALRRYDEARRILGVAAVQPGQDSERVGVLFQLGVAHLRSGDQAAARACLEQVLRIDPSRADANHLLSTLPA